MVEIQINGMILVVFKIRNISMRILLLYDLIPWLHSLVLGFLICSKAFDTRSSIESEEQNLIEYICRRTLSNSKQQEAFAYLLSKTDIRKNALSLDREQILSFLQNSPMQASAAASLSS